ncbi:MAG TPA: 4-hydroxythreonine-4-phosphate dehydrogenase PdxA [Blastocatellia bacterium]|nr:4-hydroxythreonine-4-phosphate dehydrogenase PdxA [Blastocatellia bacterium]
MFNSHQVPIAITMGDPSGIGPEIIAKLFSQPDDFPPAIVVGDAGMIERSINKLGLPISVRSILKSEDAKCDPFIIDVIQAGGALPEDLPIGQVNPRAGQAAFDAIIKAIELARAEKVNAITTAPINKESLHAAGIKYPGHTEILADYGGAGEVAMMLMNDELRVVLVTVHAALRKIVDAITTERELATIRLAYGAARMLGFDRPRVAVAGLNPHAGENGLFGDEDKEIIAPAIAQAHREGIDATGPWPGDTVFMRARRGDFDIVVAQYHDQGLIPVKYLGIDHGVNITLGLPFVRTSVDHGTAFDIAGRGIADPSSLRHALLQAALMTRARTLSTK